MPDPRTIKVFIASPGDLTVERRAFKDVIDELNAGFGRGADVRFEPLGWEDALSTVGRRSQAVINQDIDACDVFVLVMWRRWGQEAPDAGPYSSYTEEEFYRALARYEKGGAPASPTIFVFFKHIDPGQMADPGGRRGTGALPSSPAPFDSRRWKPVVFSDEGRAPVPLHPSLPVLRPLSRRERRGVMRSVRGYEGRAPVLTPRTKE